MTSTIQYIQLIIISLSLIFGGCNQKKTALIEKTRVVKKINLAHEKFIFNTITDTLKYKKHVFGIDEEGNSVQGHINIEGQNGIGVLVDDQGQKIEIVFELENNKKLVATDVQGFKYKLKID